MKQKCKSCGKKFTPIKGAVYQVREESTLVEAIGGNTKKIYEAIDCPKCGCQKLLGIRIPKFEETDKDC